MRLSLSDKIILKFIKGLRSCRPDISTLVADHGLIAQLQTVVRIQDGKVCPHQPSETVVKMDPAGVAGDGHVANTHFRFVKMTRGYDGDWHHHLVKVSFKAAADLEQRATFLVSHSSTINNTKLLSFLRNAICWNCRNPSPIGDG